MGIEHPTGATVEALDHAVDLRCSWARQSTFDAACGAQLITRVITASKSSSCGNRLVRRVHHDLLVCISERGLQPMRRVGKVLRIITMLPRVYLRWHHPKSIGKDDDWRSPAAICLRTVVILRAFLCKALNMTGR